MLQKIKCLKNKINKTKTTDTHIQHEKESTTHFFFADHILFIGHIFFLIRELFLFFFNHQNDKLDRIVEVCKLQGKKVILYYRSVVFKKGNFYRIYYKIYSTITFYQLS